MLIAFSGDADKRLAPVFGMRDDGALLVESAAGLRYLPPNDGNFEVVDGRRSEFWVRGADGWAFPEWSVPYFGENLANGAEREAAVVKCYRELFLREFPRAGLELPKYHGNGLIRCPRCGRIFEPLSFLGWVRCNGFRCRLEMNNPFYDPARLRESCEWGQLEYALAAGQGGYYHAETRRYYPRPPTRRDLWCGQIVSWLDEFRRRRRHRRWQELRRLCRRHR